MCVIAFSPDPDQAPSAAELEGACRANPDGFGWAIVDGDHIIVRKTMNADEAVETFLALRKNAEGQALFHARIASHGTVDLANCHPFSVGGDQDIVLAHNGILDITPGPFDDRSDTAIFAAEVLPANGIETLDTNPEEWENWLGKGNKVVVLSTSPRLRRQAYILNESSGLWDGNGVWWSNSSYDYVAIDDWRDWEDGDDDVQFVPYDSVVDCSILQELYGEQ